MQVRGAGTGAVLAMVVARNVAVAMVRLVMADGVKVVYQALA